MSDAATLEQDIARIKAMSLGDPVTNVCAGEGNPHRHGLFVEYVEHRRKNRYGIVHTQQWARCKHKDGRISRHSIDVIFPGHLTREESAIIFAPIWEKHFGKPGPEQPSATA